MGSRPVPLRSTARLLLACTLSILLVSLPLVLWASRPAPVTGQTDEPEAMRELRG